MAREWVTEETEEWKRLREATRAVMLQWFERDYARELPVDKMADSLIKFMETRGFAYVEITWERTQ